MFPTPEALSVLPRYIVPKQPCLSIIMIRRPVAPNYCLSSGGVSLYIPGYQRNFFFPGWTKLHSVSGQHLHNNTYLLTKKRKEKKRKENSKKRDTSWALYQELKHTTLHAVFFAPSFLTWVNLMVTILFHLFSFPQLESRATLLF